MTTKQIFSLVLSFALGLCAVSCGTADAVSSDTQATSSEPKPVYEDFTVTVVSDVHHGVYNYNNVRCLDAFKKLDKIIEETPDSAFYLNLGDFIDNMGRSLVRYEEAIDFLAERNIEIYNTNKYIPKTQKTMYTLIGNHEVNTYPKSELAHILPYEDGIGQVFHFKYGGVFFVAIDGVYSAKTGNCTMEDMNWPCPYYTIPEPQAVWFKEVIDANMNETVKEVVLLSHIPVKDFSPQTVLLDLVDYVADNYGAHVTMFDGHTHVRQETDHKRDGVSYFTEYTLPAMNIDDGYDYYTVSFSNGRIENVSMHLGQTL